MRLILSLIVVSVFCFSGMAQDKIQWQFSYNKQSQSVEAKATIASGWHLYSQFIEPGTGPVATQILFDYNKLVQLVGQVSEPAPITHYDETFGTELAYFEKSAVFSQKITYAEPTLLKGNIVFMLCNDSMCLPPEEKQFTIELK
jgi:hypothetical protein